jgi:EcsC protein family
MPQMIEINPADPKPPLTDAARADVAALAARQRRANGLLMKAVNFAGGQVEDGMKLLPKAVRGQIEGAIKAALLRSYEVASRSRRSGVLGSDRAHRVLGTVSGALGGLGGLPTALAELPIATTLIFRAVQGVAAQYGEDPLSAETRIECLRVFGAGGPGDADDGIDTGFIGARISITGPAIGKIIAKVAPRFGAVLSQKLMTQAIPIIGAAAGAGTNYAFVDYYIEMAHVHFGLRRVARDHGDTAVADVFHRALAEGKLPKP